MYSKRSIPEIKESSEELEKLLKEEKSPRLKQRLRMLLMLKTGEAQGVQEAANKLFVNQSSVSEWLDKYEAGGLSGMLEVKKHPKRESSIPADILSELKAKLQGNHHEFRNYHDICDWLKKEFNLDIPYHTLYGIIHTQLRIKPEFKKGSTQTQEPHKSSKKEKTQSTRSSSKKEEKKANKNSRGKSINRRRFIDLENAKKKKRQRRERREEALKEMKRRLKAVRRYKSLQKQGLNKEQAARQAAEEFNCSSSTIRKWNSLYDKHGRYGILPDYKKRTYEVKTPFSVIQVILMMRCLLHWGGDRISAELESRGIYKISPQGVYNIFRRYGVRTRTYHPKGKRTGINYRKWEVNKPNEVWHMDFAGPFVDEKGNKCYILVVIDAYSRFLIDLYVCSSLETNPIIDRLKKLFEQYGKPEKIVTDNGRTFCPVSEDSDHLFQKFLKDNGIEHKRIQAYYPEANGKAEAAVKIVKNEAMKPFLKIYPKFSMEQMQTTLDGYRGYYNFYRLHGGIGWQIPAVKYQYFIGKEQTPKGLEHLFFINPLEFNFDFC